MKLVRYGPVGQERPGMIDPGGKVRDLSAHVPDIAGAVLSPESLARLAALNPEGLPLIYGSPRFGPIVAHPSKFIGVGLNYSDHAAEVGSAVPSEPILFQKATSCICGAYDKVILPPRAEKLDWEVELGVVIGTTARYVAEADAMSHIAGYCVVNDLSERSWQMERGGQWTKGKSGDTFGPIGPWLVTKDEIADVSNLALFLEVNGQRRQTGNTATMAFKPAFLVHHISQFMTLLPGDIIATGTPPGVGIGMSPPQFLKAGDVMRLGVAGLGEQKQTVVAWSA
jgi:2-keto-4-pentenoate hydratase/2-oxohepta-3-ene-1,7-dioic acid hydratase in catechol pathway